jgi:hypothetical protein
MGSKWSSRLRWICGTALLVGVVMAATVFLRDGGTPRPAPFRELSDVASTQATRAGARPLDTSQNTVVRGDLGHRQTDRLSEYQVAFIAPSLEVLRETERRAVDNNDLDSMATVELEKARLVRAAAGLPRFPDER